ncbi:hypothetical protein BUE80_DR010444 [Diplocarpon rosae]|nr:hypothetical protein BUE80_DR010444 [Diplocarpon rosae]
MIRNVATKAIPSSRPYLRPLLTGRQHGFRGPSGTSLHQKFMKTNSSQAYYSQKNCSTVNDLHETIYALSTGSGGAIAIVRISGPACDQIYAALCPNKSLPAARNIAVRTLYSPLDPTNILDSDAVVLRLIAPRSSTGEDMLELHVHGGPATVRAVMSAIAEVNPRSIRAAGPGEFTRRAFANEKLDLAQIESLGDTLSAHTEQQRRAAVRGRSGELSRAYHGLQKDLQIQRLVFQRLTCLETFHVSASETEAEYLLHRAQLAADVDFGESEDLEGIDMIWSGVVQEVKLIQSRITKHQVAVRYSELIRKGIHISLIGHPNAGKSSLFNQILGTQTSIVNQQAGTTRDIIEATVDVKGYLCTIADTAGVRTRGSGSDSEIGEIEEEGIRRAIAKAQSSDMIVLVVSPERDNTGRIKLWVDQSSSSVDQGPQSDSALWSIIRGEDGIQKPAVVVLNKVETLSKEELSQSLSSLQRNARAFLSNPDIVPILPVSVALAENLMQTGNPSPDAGNMGTFITVLVKTFKSLTSVPVEMADLIGATERQRQLLEQCTEYLRMFVHYAEEKMPAPDAAIAIHHLDNAANCLVQITGRDTMGVVGDVEEILGVVFEKFCVGK